MPERSSFSAISRLVWIVILTLLTIVGAGMTTPLMAEQPESGKPDTEVTHPTVWTAEAAHTAIRMHNPEYNGQGQFFIQNGQVAAARLSGTGVTDLTPLSGMGGLFALDVRGLPVEDLSALAGLPLKKLYLEDTLVADLGPLKGMSLRTLYLGGTKVADLTPLSGMPLRTLNLLGLPVADISPLTGMPLEYLWLNETPVADLSPLTGCPLISLTLHKTQIENLEPLAGGKLQRLHIGDTPVSDLTPLKDLTLHRLIFTPRTITTGLNIARKMASIREIGPAFDDRMDPAAFWARYDKGDFK